MKVKLVREQRGYWYHRNTKPISASLPFYEREGGGYVHRVRSAHLHYDENGTHTHTSVSFWCGAAGFLYPKGRQNKKHAPAYMAESPSPGRVICATCQGRAHGAGQVGDGRLGNTFVRYKPHGDFFPARLRENTA